MKERPIRLYANEVRATLEGRQTQIRRVVKPQPCAAMVPGVQRRDHWSDGNYVIRCLYGASRDRLWVRETWCDTFAEDDDSIGGYCYAATNKGPEPLRWRPSIHMPRSASRILLEIEAVRVERLNDISAADAIAEGVFADGQYNTDPPLPYPVATFKALWESINGQGSWDLNPWVWVIQFRRVQP